MCVALAKFVCKLISKELDFHGKSAVQYTTVQVMQACFETGSTLTMCSQALATRHSSEIAAPSCDSTQLNLARLLTHHRLLPELRC